MVLQPACQSPWYWPVQLAELFQVSTEGNLQSSSWLQIKEASDPALIEDCLVTPSFIHACLSALRLVLWLGVGGGGKGP